MTESDGLEFPISLDLSSYSDGITDAIASAGDLDAALNDIASTALDTQNALDGLAGGVDVSIDVILAGDGVLTDLASLDEAVYTPTVDLVLAGDEYDKVTGLADDTYAPQIDPALDVTNIDKVQGLNTETVAPSIDPGLVSTNVDKVTTLDDEVVTPSIDPQESAQGKEVLNRLDQIRNLQVVQIALNLVGNAADVLGKLEEFTVQPLLDTENAVAALNARTGETIPNVEALITSLKGQGLGTDIDQIASVLEQATHLDIPQDQFADAARGALQVTEVFTDQDPVQVLSTMNDLVARGIVPNFQAAADLLTTGFQEFGTGFDFAGLIQDYQTELEQFGISGPQAINLVKTAIESGIDPTKAFDSIREFQNLLNSSVGDAESDTSKALEQLNIPNPAELGEEVGIDFFTAAIDAIKNNPGEGMTREQLITALFGSPGEEVGTNLLGLDANANPFDSLTGAAETAATTINDTLTGQLGLFFDYVQQEAAEFLSSDQIDLPGKIEALKTGLGDAIAVLQNGGTLDEAIEVGLKPLGFDEVFTQLESVFGNLIIGFLQIVADVQDILGKDSSGTRSEITRLGETQLAYDLKISNPDELSAVIATAVDRGVDVSTISTQVGTAVNELIASGDVEKAQELLDGLDSVAGAVITVSNPFTAEELRKQGILEEGSNQITIPIWPDVDQDVYEAAVQDAITQMNARTAGLGGINVEFTPQLDQEQLGVLQDQVDAARVAAIKPTAASDDASSSFGAGANTQANAPDVAASTDDAQTAAIAATDAAAQATTSAVEASNALDIVETASTRTTNAIDENSDDAINASASMDESILANSDSIVASFAAERKAAEEELQIVVDVVNALDAALINAAGSASVLEGSLGLAVSSGVAAVAGGGSTSALPEYAEGGLAQGTFSVGEEGREILSSDSSVAVLNNQTTEDIYGAVAAVLAGAGTVNTYNNTNSPVVNQIYYVQSQAQAMSAGQQTANAIRGH